MSKEILIEGVDVLVIGGGMAGCFAAIKAKEAGSNKVVQVDKGFVGKSGCASSGAGVLHVFFPEEDDLDDRIKRLVRSLGYLAQQDLVKDHLEQSFDILKDMERFGVDLSKTPDGKFSRVAGRGTYPAVMFRGYQMMDAIAKAVKRYDVEQVHKVMITDLLTRDGQVIGAVGFNIQDGDFYVFRARATIVATGGTWYKTLSPGQRDVTADGNVASYRAGALLSGAENPDFVANAFAARYDIGPGMSMFVGQGGRFVNAKGERFMERYFPTLKERVGLTLLNAAFIMEIKQGNGPIYLDMTHFTLEQVQRLRFALPLVMKMFERGNFLIGDRIVQPIEWMLTAPMARPGIVVNRKFESSLPGLYACGDAASPYAVVTGLASAATSGAAAGRFATEYAEQVSPMPIRRDQLKRLKVHAFQPLQRKNGIEPDQIILSLQETIFPFDVLLLRHEERMKKALQRVEEIRDNDIPLLCAYDPHYLKAAHEAYNLTLTAEIHLKTAIRRRESRVALREDFPCVDNLNWLKWIEVIKENGDMKLTTKDVPVETYPLKLERKTRLNHLWELAQNLGIVTIKEGEVTWA